jgi:hypothetical protein
LTTLRMTRWPASSSVWTAPDNRLGRTQYAKRRSQMAVENGIPLLVRHLLITLSQV